MSENLENTPIDRKALVAELQGVFRSAFQAKTTTTAVDFPGGVVEVRVVLLGEIMWASRDKHRWYECRWPYVERTHSPCADRA